MTKTLVNTSMDTSAGMAVQDATDGGDTTSRDAILKEAAHLNAEGLGCLDSMNFNGAYSCFRSGISLLNKHLNAPEGRIIPVGGASAMEGVTMASWFTPNRIPGLKDEAFYVHAHAFGITPSCEGKTSTGDMQVASLVILFNLALTFHQVGSLYMDKDKLTRACMLYTNCAQLALYYGGDAIAGAPPHQFLPHAVYVFCRNNQAQILYRFIGKQDSALTLLISMKDKAHYLSQTIGGPMRCLFEDVMLNVVIFPAAPLIGTPAA